MSTYKDDVLNQVENALKLNPDLKFMAVHGVVDGKCTCGKPHYDTKEIGKHPVHTAWQQLATGDVAVISNWLSANPDYNLGIACKESGIIAIDVDPRSGGHISIDKLDERATYSLIPTVTARTGRYEVKGRSMQGSHLLYKCDRDEKLHGNLKSSGLEGIDIKHAGYIVASPSRHISGVSYEWEAGKAPWEIEITPAPEELLSALRTRAKPDQKNKKQVSFSQEDPLTWVDLVELSNTASKVDISGIIEAGLVEGERAVEVYRFACALANKFGTDDVSRTVIEEFMMSWNSRNIRPPLEVEGANGLLMHVRRAIDWVAENPLNTLPSGQVDGEVFQLTDTNDATVVEWLAQFAEKEFCWNKARGWLRYTEGLWDCRSDEHFLEYLRAFLKAYWISAKSSELGVGAATEIKKLLSASKLKNYAQLLKGNLEVLDDKFDQKHDLLNVKNGVVDLKTGSLAPHDPRNYFTRICSVGFIPGAMHPDVEKAKLAIPDYARDFMQSYLGQACSGWVAHEDYVLVLQGGGRNGKSTFVHLPRLILGGFAVQVSDKILSAKDGDHSTDLTDLRGRRLAILEEFPKGPVNTKRLKDVSGTAQMSARRMREDNKTWTPTHALVVTSNHELQVDASDDGTWRRLLKLDFPYRYVTNPLLPNERQVELGLRERLHQGLQGQHEAMLAWLVQGAMKWYENGKRLPLIPKEMLDSMNEWRSAQDKIGTFLRESLEVNPASCVAFDDLYTYYRASNAEDFDSVSVKDFSSSTRSSEFFQSNGLKSSRKRTASITVSRPNCDLLPLPIQATLILGVCFKH
jgi:putative DNA primase/helicase